MQKMIRGLIIFAALFANDLYASRAQDIARATNSFLTAQSFPKTFQDLTFQQRVQVIAEGYEPWETEYDASGHCISGCAYSEITLDKELDKLQRQTQYANRHLEQIQQQQIQQKQQITQPQEQHLVQQQYVLPQNPDAENVGVSYMYSVPVGMPVRGNPRISSPFGARIHPVTGNRQIHKGVDFAVVAGTDVYAPAAGTVTKVWQDNTCGNGIKIKHDMGYETVYCHLSQQLVKQGDVIKPGYIIAKSGNSGRSTGAHLHYAIKYNDEYIDPIKFINQ